MVCISTHASDRTPGLAWRSAARRLRGGPCSTLARFVPGLVFALAAGFVASASAEVVGFWTFEDQGRDQSGKDVHLSVETRVGTSPADGPDFHSAGLLKAGNERARAFTNGRAVFRSSDGTGLSTAPVNGTALDLTGSFTVEALFKPAAVPAKARESMTIAEIWGKGDQPERNKFRFRALVSSRTGKWQPQFMIHSAEGEIMRVTGPPYRRGKPYYVAARYRVESGLAEVLVREYEPDVPLKRVAAGNLKTPAELKKMEWKAELCVGYSGNKTRPRFFMNGDLAALRIGDAWLENDDLLARERAPFEYVVRTGLRIPSAGERPVDLICHRMLFGLETLTRNSHHLFKDETLLDPRDGMHAEVRLARRAGASIFIQRGAEDELLSALEGTSARYTPLFNCAPLVFKRFGVETWQDLAGLYTEWYRTYGDHPCVWRRNGKPLLFTFRSDEVPPDDWRRVRALLEEQGHEGIFLFHPTLPRHRDYEALYERYLEVFDGAFIWGGRTPMKVQAAKAANKVRAGMSEPKILYWAVLPGYWRPEKGWVRDRNGTRNYRDQLQLGYELGVDGIILESWNDFSENHQIMPSLMNHTAILDLLASLNSRANPGQSAFMAPQPGIYLSALYEVLAGRVLDIEVLQLPVSGGGRPEIKVDLRTAAGETVRQWQDLRLDAGTGDVLRLRFPTADLSNAAAVIPYVTVNGRQYETGVWTVIRPDRVRDPRMRHVSLARVLQPETLSFSVSGAKPGERLFEDDGSRRIQIDVRDDDVLERVEVARNGKPVFAADWHRRLSRENASDAVGVSLFWRAPTVYHEEEMDYSGRLDVENGRLVDAYLIKEGRSVKVDDRRASWSDQDLVLKNGVTFAVVPEGDTIFRLQFPELDTSLAISLKELRASKLVEHAITPHTLLATSLTHEPLGLPVALNAESYRAGFSVSTRHEPDLASYVLRLMGRNQSLYRTPPVFVASRGVSTPREVTVLDEHSGKPATMTCPGFMVRGSAWTFDNASGRFARDSGGAGFDLQLGGNPGRDGRYQPDAIPERAPGTSGQGLHFDGDDYVWIPPLTFPQGAYAVEFEVKPQLTGTVQQLVYCPPYLDIRIRKDGTLRVEQGDGPEAVLASSGTLTSGQWSHVRVSYDLEQVVLALDGKEQARTAAAGLRKYPSRFGWIGAGVKHQQGGTAFDGFTGMMDEIRVTGSAN